MTSCQKSKLWGWIKSKINFKIKEHILLGLMWAWRTVDWSVVVGSCSQLLRNRSVTVSVLSQSSWWVVAGSCQIKLVARYTLKTLVWIENLGHQQIAAVTNSLHEGCQYVCKYLPTAELLLWRDAVLRVPSSFTCWNMLFAAIVLPKQSQEGLRGSIFF